MSSCCHWSREKASRADIGDSCRNDAFAVKTNGTAAEDEVVVVILQRLVGEVDAQLLEGVDFEVLEAEDVEQPDPVLLAVAVEQLIALVDEP